MMSIMMTSHKFALLICAALFGWYKTAYAVLILKQHMQYYGVNDLFENFTETAYCLHWETAF